MQPWRAAHFECRKRNSQLAVLDTKWEDSTLRGYLNSQEMSECLSLSTLLFSVIYKDNSILKEKSIL